MEIETYMGAPHQVFGMDKVLALARTIVADTTKVLGDVFNTA